MRLWTGNEKLLIGPPKEPEPNPVRPWQMLVVMLCVAAIVAIGMSYRMGRYDERIIQAQLHMDREYENLERCLVSFNEVDREASRALVHIQRDHEVIESFLALHPSEYGELLAGAW